MAYKAFITYLACGATIACSQKHKFSVSFFRYNAYIKLNRDVNIAQIESKHLT